MDVILMLKDKEVYNVTKGVVLEYKLLPTLMKRMPCLETFNTWWRLRKSSNTNVSSRLIKSRAFGNNNKIVDVATKGLSLTDCYWVKRQGEEMQFEQVSPYFKPFWKGTGVYEGQAIPTLYVDGYLTKEWISSSALTKPFSVEEYESYKLAKQLDIECATYVKSENGLVTINFTSPDRMLEQAIQQTKYYNGDYDIFDIIQDFSNGMEMVILDAIIGNGDRHPGNFGNIIYTDTGEVVESAPIYDFDHALDSIDPTYCVLIKELIHACAVGNLIKAKTIRMCKQTLQVDTLDEFKTRAKRILDELNKGDGSNG